MENYESLEFSQESFGIDDKKRRKKKRRKIIKWVILLILGVILFFGADFFLRLRSAFNQAHNPIQTINLREQEMDLGGDPISILILGIDSDGPHDRGRSDVMMLATINPNTNTTYLVSLARDTMVYIVGHGSTTRINHAYAYGGPEMSVNTVQNFLNIPIDYYVEVRMDTFSPLIDAVGGVTVYNDTVAFSMSGHDFPLGYVDLDGDAARAYVRMRMQDPHGDFGRQQRQRSIMGALAGELANIRTVTRYQELLDIAGDGMRTDVTLGNMVTISTRYGRALRNITDLDLRGPSQMVNGMSLVIVSEHDRLEMSNRLRGHLELD